MQLHFDDPLLEGLYEFGSPPKARFRCTAALRNHFVKVLNKLGCMTSRSSFFSYRALDCQVLDAHRALFSVKVTPEYRLEFSCQEQDGLLIQITVCALRPTSALLPSS